MPASLDDLRTLAGRCLGIPVRVVETLPGGGSQRTFHRLEAGGGTAIGVIGAHLPEVRAFLGFTTHFAAAGIPVPAVLGADESRGLYLLEDLGDTTLAAHLAGLRSRPGGAADARAASAHAAPEVPLTSTVRWLPMIQVRGGAGLDDTLCWEGRELDGAAFRADVERFLAHFVPRFALRPAPLTAAAQAELDELLARLDALPREHFCYRDFQTRNIMWVARPGDSAPGPVFLDYQSGRRGPLAYDLASLLYSPDTGADDDLRTHLIDAYLDALAGEGVTLARAEFLAAFHPIVLVRRLQALGRYAELVAVGKQAAFLAKIPPALADLRALQAAGRFDFGLPAFEDWLAGVLGS